MPLPQLPIVRPTSVYVPPPTGALRVGSARVDLTPGLGRGIAGHGPTNNSAQGWYGRLFANATLIEDPDGQRVALIQCDLLAGSRYVTERLAVEVAGDLGLTTDRIWLAGSHSHRGPASIYGNHSYDRLLGTAWPSLFSTHFDRTTAERYVTRLADTLRGIVDGARPTVATQRISLRPATLSFATRALWKVVRNRSGRAYDGIGSGLDPADYIWKNDPPAADRDALALWLAEEAAPPTIEPLAALGLPAPNAAAELAALQASGADGPFLLGAALLGALDEETTLEPKLKTLLQNPISDPLALLLSKHVHSERARPMGPAPGDYKLCDPRLYCLIARDTSGAPISVFVTIGGTPSLLGSRHAVWSGDVAGEAANRVRDALGAGRCPVGLAAGCVGDANVVPPGETIDSIRDRMQDIESALALVQEVGQLLADGILAVLFDTSVPRFSGVQLSIDFEERAPAAFPGLDPDAILGAAALPGSELSRTALSALFQEGDKPKVHEPGVQAPKVKLPRLQQPPEVLSIRLLTLRRSTGVPIVAMCGLPIEASAALSATLRDRLRAVAANPTLPVMNASVVGGYAAYAGVQWEYVSQSYEAASTLWGRFTGDSLVDAVAARYGHGSTVAPIAQLSGAAMATPLRLGSQAKKPSILSASIGLKSGPGLFGGRIAKLLKGKPRVEIFDREDGGIDVYAAFDATVPTNDPQPFVGRWVSFAYKRANGQVVDAVVDGAPVDDVQFPFLLWCEASAPGKRGRYVVGGRWPGAKPGPGESILAKVYAPLAVVGSISVP